MSTDDKNFPPLFVQAHNLMKQAISSGADMLKGKPLMASMEKAKARLDICSICEFFHQSRCLKCGCYMEKKVHLESSQCPLNKWGESSGQAIPSSNLVSIDSFPENERDRVADVARYAAENKQSFHIGQVKYTSRLNEDGTVSIFTQKTLPAPKTYISDLPPEELSQFNALVAQAKNSQDNTFTFKNLKFAVTVDGDKTITRIVR